MLFEMFSTYAKDIVLAILGVLGGWVVSLFFYRKAIQRKEISFATDIDRLIWSKGPAFSDIELLYKGKKLSDPRKATVYIWNSGNCTIDANEIASADQLTLGASNITILSREIARSTRDVIDAKIDTKSASESLVTFDFLDPGDGIAVELFYDISTEQTAMGRTPELSGTLKGSRQPPILRDVSFQNKILNRVGQSLSLLFVLLVTAALLVFQVFEIMQASGLLIAPKFLTAVLLSIICLGISFASISTWRAYRIPRSLKADQSERKFPRSYNDVVDIIEQQNDVAEIELRELRGRIAEIDEKLAS